MRNSALPVEVAPGQTATLEILMRVPDPHGEVDERARFFTSLPETPWFDVRVQKEHADGE